MAAYKLAVQTEISAGVLRLKQQVPSANVAVWAAPFNDAGQWTNLYNDPSGQAQAWLPGYLASKFQVVFTQTNPITYGQASGTVGSLAGFNRRYRYEVRNDYDDPAVRRTPAGPGLRPVRCGLELHCSCSRSSRSPLRRGAR